MTTKQEKEEAKARRRRIERRTNLAIVVILLLTLAAAPVMWAVQYWECGHVCEAQASQRMWTFTQGCFCVGEDGAYNPKDQRE